MGSPQTSRRGGVVFVKAKWKNLGKPGGKGKRTRLRAERTPRGKPRPTQP